MKVINFLSRKPIYGFLSNFHRCPLTMETEWGIIEYPTGEHAYQCGKATTRRDHDFVLMAPRPLQAKRAGGNLKKIKHSWDEKRAPYMLKVLRAKFRDAHLQIRFLRTGNAILQEDNPHDLYWGKDGENMLGVLLMKARKEIRDFNNRIGVNEDSICFICGAKAVKVKRGLAVCMTHCKKSELKAMIYE